MALDTDADVVRLRMWMRGGEGMGGAAKPLALNANFWMIF